MLDLTSIIRPTQAIKISDDITVNIYPANKAMIDKAMKLNKITDSDELYGFAAEILSINKENKKIKVSDIKHLDMYALTILFQTYTSFIGKLEADPN
jgi:hypothetical protein